MKNLTIKLCIFLTCLNFLSYVNADESSNTCIKSFNEKDYKTAYEACLASAKKGNAESQNDLGMMYANGLGVHQDDKEVIKWWQLAADQGHAEAQSSLSKYQK